MLITMHNCSDRRKKERESEIYFPIRLLICCSKEKTILQEIIVLQRKTRGIQQETKNINQDLALCISLFWLLVEDLSSSLIGEWYNKDGSSNLKWDLAEWFSYENIIKLRTDYCAQLVDLYLTDYQIVACFHERLLESVFI